MLRALRSAILSNPWTSMSCISAWGWGVTLAMPGDTLARPTYKYMGVVAPEDYWTALFLTLAVLQTWRLFKRTTRKLFPYELALKAVACLTWTFVCVACFAAQWPLAAAMSDSLAIAVAAWIDMSRCDPCSGCPVKGMGLCGKGCFLCRNTDYDC